MTGNSNACSAKSGHGSPHTREYTRSRSMFIYDVQKAENVFERASDVPQLSIIEPIMSFDVTTQTWELSRIEVREEEISVGDQRQAVKIL